MNKVGLWKSIIIQQWHLHLANGGPSMNCRQPTLPCQVDWWCIRDMPHIPEGGCTALYDVACSLEVAKKQGRGLPVGGNHQAYVSRQSREGREDFVQCLLMEDWGKKRLQNRQTCAQVLVLQCPQLLLTIWRQKRVEHAVEVTPVPKKKPRRGTADLSALKVVCDAAESEHWSSPLPSKMCQKFGHLSWCS